jgi:hypothetical protein
VVHVLVYVHYHIYSEYWSGLLSYTDFTGKKRRQCLDVIHYDIVSVWNIRNSSVGPTLAYDWFQRGSDCRREHRSCGRCHARYSDGQLHRGSARVGRPSRDHFRGARRKVTGKLNANLAFRCLAFQASSSSGEIYESYSTVQ